MLKDCNNCYWQGYKNKWCIYEENKPSQNTCEKHSFICEKCDGDEAEYIFEGDYV